MKTTIDLRSLKEYAKSLGIGTVGYMAVDRLGHYSLYQEEKLTRSLCCPLSLAFDQESSLRPDLVLNGAKGFVVALFPNKLQSAIAPETNSVSLSEGSNFYDYHKILNQALTKLSEFMQLQWDANTHVLIDNHPFPERFIAKEAGLGCIGKNSYLLSQTYGTATYIGLILTDVACQETKVIDDLCGDCVICIEACPNQALVKGRFVNDHKCISYLTQKKNLNEWDMRHMHKSLYGCDICSKACPYTKAYVESTHHENTPIKLVNLETLLQEEIGLTEDMGLMNQVKIHSLIKLSNKAFSSTIGLTSAGWIGKKRLQRNALVALQHSDLTYQKYCLNLIESDERDEILTVKAFIKAQSQETL